MDQENQGNEDTSSSPESYDAGSTSNNQEQAASQEQSSEKMVPQSEINKMMGKVRSEAERKAYERAQKEFESRQSSNVGGMKAPTPEEIEKLIDQKVDERAQKAYATQLLTDFTQKLKAGVEKHSDFDEVVSDLNLASNPHLVRWANGLDNTADVLYDLGKNPEKYASVMMLASSSPNLALKKLQQLSESIKLNEEGKKALAASEPLDHLKPSTTGMDNGSLTVSDLQKVDWLRG